MGRLLEWHGDAIVAKVERAAAAETVAVVDRAVEEARANTPVLTGEARDSLERENEGLAVTWGYHVVDEQGNDRGIWIEIGARGRAGAHALRRAADAQYGQLASGIRRRLGL